MQPHEGLSFLVENSLSKNTHVFRHSNISYYFDIKMLWLWLLKQKSVKDRQIRKLDTTIKKWKLDENETLTKDIECLKKYEFKLSNNFNNQ